MSRLEQLSRTACAGRHRRPAGLMRGLDRCIRRLVDASLVLAGSCIIVILLIGTADTVGRVLWDRSVLGAVEITQALLAVTIFASLAYVQKQGGHILVDVFSSRYGPRLTRITTILILILTLAALTLLTWRTGVTAARGWQLNEVAQGFIPVPIWLAKMVATACLGIACIEALRQLIRVLAGLHPSGEPAVPLENHQDESRED